MERTMTRRALLRGSVAAGLAPATGWSSTPDAVVLDRAAAFDRAYREQSEGWRGVASVRERAMRHPDCPRPPLRSRDALKRFAEHMRRQGVEQTVGRAQTLSRAAADAARAAFDVEAREPAGALAKDRKSTRLNSSH